MKDKVELSLFNIYSQKPTSRTALYNIVTGSSTAPTTSKQLLQSTLCHFDHVCYKEELFYSLLKCLRQKDFLFLYFPFSRLCCWLVPTLTLTWTWKRDKEMMSVRDRATGDRNRWSGMYRNRAVTVELFYGSTQATRQHAGDDKQTCWIIRLTWIWPIMVIYFIIIYSLVSDFLSHTHHFSKCTSKYKLTIYAVVCGSD